MEFDDHILQEFLGPQIRDYGCRVEIDEGLWTLFAVPSTDALADAIARSLLGSATFAHDSGHSADEQWKLFYVDTANRPAAIHWLDTLSKTLAGEIRPVAPAQRALIEELITSPKPHRVAQQLGELRARGEITAGLIREPLLVRSLLDRLHQREPLFFAAFLTLLNQHLVDLVVLLQQMIPEDVALKNEIVMGGLSHDPFLQSRQDAAAEIRSVLLRYQLINPIDQQRNTAITNPYAVYFDLEVAGEEVTAALDGTTVSVPRADFLRALRTLRRNLYRGEQFSALDTQAPWVDKATAYPFRCIRQRVEAHRELNVFDVLYMLERAVGG